VRISGIVPCQEGIGIGDPHNEMPAPGFSGKKILEMIVMKNMKPAVNHCQFDHFPLV
jgi:hypothetical protein